MLLNVTASLKQATTAVNKPAYLGTVSPKCSRGPGEMALAFLSVIYACVNYIRTLRHLMATHHWEGYAPRNIPVNFETCGRRGAQHASVRTGRVCRFGAHVKHTSALTLHDLEMHVK